MNREMRKKAGEKVEEYFGRIAREYKIEGSYQEVTSEQVELVLNAIGKNGNDVRDAVWCLLNNKFPSLFSKAVDYKLSDGASIAHIASYIGILMRGGNKLDREGRDYWIKPLREIGAIDAFTYDSKTGFLPGHIKPKSPNSCYRLNSGFVALLKASGENDFEIVFKDWISGASIRKRLEIQKASQVATINSLEENPHKTLIQYSINLYAKHFLPGYIVIYKDDSDGDRICEEERILMEEYGILLELEDSFPDVVLFNPDINAIWFIEAVTSDGEVDEHKLNGLKHICEKSGKRFGGSTTTYLKWKAFASRQQSNKNLADSSKVWIVEDPQKQFEVQSMA